jgi:precorrin-6Y C5,15-methyltransferase (decarboxylating)
MRRPWLTLVGIGADGLPGLGEQARKAIAEAEILVGGCRHLALLPEDHRLRIAWRSPLVDTLGELLALRGRSTAVLATGDPLWFGVGRLLLRHLPPDEVWVLPQVSAFQLAAARLGWPLEAVVATSLHSRPLARLRRLLTPGRRLLLLSESGSTPAAVAVLLREAGYGRSRLWVLEELAGPAERIVERQPADLVEERFADLNLVALELESTAPSLPIVTPLPDSAFSNDGQLTKQEVRAMTLAALAPRPGELLWDVGAGAGSVAIDWLRAEPSLRAIAVERHAERAERIRKNAEWLGVPELQVVEAEAPACLAGLAPPDAVFVGGGTAAAGMLEAAYAQLRPRGRLVASAVTLAGEAALLAFHACRGGRLIRLGLSRAEPLGAELGWRVAHSLTQLIVEKPCGAAS